MLQVHAVDDADRLRGNEVAARHADVGIRHRRIRQPHRQQRFDFHTHPPDRFFHALHGLGIGEADAVMIGVIEIVFRQMLFDLRACAVDQHQPDAEAGEQIEVVRQLNELAVRDHFAAEGDYEGTSAERVDIRRDGTEPCDEVSRCARAGCGDVRHLNPPDAMYE